MADVFVSYKREDRSRVAPLVRALQERGFTVWWDKRINTGADWMARITAELNSAHAVVVVWSGQSVTAEGQYVSEIVAAEAECARQKGKLQPVRLDASAIPALHALRNGEDLSGWNGQGDDARIVRLAEHLIDVTGDRTLPGAAELSAWFDAEAADNATAYRRFREQFPRSRFAAISEPRAAEIEQRAADLQIIRQAADRITDGFAAEAEMPAFTVPLALERIESQRVVAYAREELFARLSEGGKAVLQAEPGAGKSTSLLQLARALGSSSPECIGVYMRLKELARLGGDIIAHLTRLESTRHVTDIAWRSLAQSGALCVFADGWNELTDNERATVGPILDLFVRSFPSAGLVIGTRPLSPAPLTGPHDTVGLQRLTLVQAHEVIESALGEKAAAALAELRRSTILRDLVRIPFFLIAFCVTREAGTSPTTRESMIGGMIAAGERRAQHEGPLRQVLSLQQGKYLSSLATELLYRQEFEVSFEDALPLINRRSAALVQAGVFTPENRPDAAAVLATLRDHHCLIEQEGTPPQFRFQHQLIQEWYAAGEVIELSAEALRSQQARQKLDSSILDRPEWAEAIRFAIERAENEEAAAYVILRMLGIDADFAAELIAAGPESVWRRVAEATGQFVQQLHASAKHRAIRFVMRCGRQEFAHFVWDAIDGSERGRGADGLRASRFRHPQVLGPDWEARMATQPAQTRGGLLTMLASNSGLDGAAMATRMAVRDPDPEVQVRVAEMLHFYGFDEELAEVLAAASDDTWEEFAIHRDWPELWDGQWRGNIVAAGHRALRRLEGPRRLSMALKLRKQGETPDCDLVAELLNTKFDHGQNDDRYYEELAELDGAALSSALLERALTGERVTYRAGRYIRPDTEVDQTRLLDAIRAQPRHGIFEVLSPLLSTESMNALYAELRAKHAEWRDRTRGDRGAITDRYHLLKDSLQHADKNRLADMLLALNPTEPEEIAEIADLIMRAYRSDSHRDKRPELQAGMRERIVDRLRDWSTILLAAQPLNRHALHSLGEAMATFPSPELLDPLRALLAADLNQWRAEKAEFSATRAAGRMPDPASGARMSYAFRYAENLLAFAANRDADRERRNHDEEEQVAPTTEMTDAVVDVLSAHFKDAEFGGEAARAVSRLRPNSVAIARKSRSFGGDDLRVIPDRKRLRGQLRDAPVDPVAEKLVVAIDELVAEASQGSIRLAVELCLAAVGMNCGRHLDHLSDVVIRHGPLEAKSGLMMRRLLLGHEVDAGIAESCLNELDGRRAERQWEYDQSWIRWEQLLVQMVFGGKPIQAAERLVSYDHRRQNHDERPIIEAMGLCGHTDALTALNALRERCAQLNIDHAWHDAVYAIGSEQAGFLLLDDLLNATGRRGWHERESLTSKIARLAEKHPPLRARVLELLRNGSAADMRVADIVRHFTDEAIITELTSLPGERLQYITGGLIGALRDMCVSYEPVNDSGLSDVVPVSVATVRAALLARIAAGDSGSAAATQILEAIDDYRDDYGAPPEEARHPDISAGLPWPHCAQSAWEAATRLCR